MANQNTPLSPVGEIRGVFEIFVPGLFLLIHLVLFVYCLQPGDTIENFLKNLSGNATVASILGLPVAYMLGLALRLARTNPADTVARKLFRTVRGARGMWNDGAEWWETEGEHGASDWIQTERFPYPVLMMARTAVSLPEAREFYKDTWAQSVVVRDRPGKKPLPPIRMDLFRFNVFKTAVGSVDERAGREMQGAELMVRHSASMIYALFWSTLVNIVGGFGHIASLAGLTPLLVGIGVIESVLVFRALPNLRFLRIAEVELVFTFSFLNQARLRELLSKNVTRLLSGAASGT
jgi:hypothetical protein